MKIEVWSDFVCPFCYMGKRKLETALNNFENKDEVELVFRSFELDPHAKKKYDKDINELIAQKYGITVEQAKASNDQIVEQAKSVGLNYNFHDMIPTNSFDAHRLIQYAKTEGKMNELEERIFKGYFVDSVNISDHKVLADLASEVGLDREKVLNILKSDKYGAEVRNDEASASEFGITGVPYFVFNNKYAVSGAQPDELFLEVLNKVKNEELSSLKIELVTKNKDKKASDSGNCSGGACSI